MAEQVQLADQLHAGIIAGFQRYSQQRASTFRANFGNAVKVRG